MYRLINPSEGDMGMWMPIARFLGQDWLYWWQLPLIGVLIILLIAWKAYRNKQV
jgi:hypothetical protein